MKHLSALAAPSSLLRLEAEGGLLETVLIVLLGDTEKLWGHREALVCLYSHPRMFVRSKGRSAVLSLPAVSQLVAISWIFVCLVFGFFVCLVFGGVGEGE